MSVSDPPFPHRLRLSENEHSFPTACHNWDRAVYCFSLARESDDEPLPSTRPVGMKRLDRPIDIHVIL